MGLQRQRLSLWLLPYSQQPTPTHRHTRAPPTSHTALPTAARSPPPRPPRAPRACTGPRDATRRTSLAPRQPQPHQPPPPKCCARDVCTWAATGHKRHTACSSRLWIQGVIHAEGAAFTQPVTGRHTPHMCPTGLPAGCGAAGLNTPLNATNQQIVQLPANQHSSAPGGTQGCHTGCLRTAVAAASTCKTHAGKAESAGNKECRRATSSSPGATAGTHMSSRALLVSEQHRVAHLAAGHAHTGTTRQAGQLCRGRSHCPLRTPTWQLTAAHHAHLRSWHCMFML